jgi:GDP-L-fucose synthase
MKIYVAGHRGLVGNAITREIDGGNKHTWCGETRATLDLSSYESTFNYIEKNQPDGIILAAAKVGGIGANSAQPVEFLTENMLIQINVMRAAHATGIPKLLFLGSSCIYPKFADLPITEDSLLSGKLEPTNEPYALAKIAGIKLLQGYRSEYGRNWISVMPTNLYGPDDNFDPETSHVLPAMIAKFHQAKITKANEVVLWGTGSPKREFLHVDDLARACISLIEDYDSPDPINVGTGNDLMISDLANLIKSIVGYEGLVVWDHNKPDGTPRKVLDVTKINNFGWSPKISLEDGIAAVYKNYVNQLN